MKRAALVFLTLSFPLACLAWWAPEWTQRKNLAVDTSAAGANTQVALVDAPVLVRLHAGNFPQFLSVRDGAADFRFLAADDQTPLKYHVEQFDPVSQIALAWVKLPSLAPQQAEQKFLLYFGNAQAVKGDDAGGTYDVDTAAVYHFTETSGPPVDATAYATPVVAAELIPNPASLIGGGALLAGTAPLLIADAPQLAQTAEKGFTAALWIKFDALPEAPVTVFERGGSAGLALTVQGGTASASYAGTSIAASAPLAAGSWHHLALTVGNGAVTLYLDGAVAATAPVTVAPLAGVISIGGTESGGGLVSAAIDELVLSSVARGADHIAFSAAVQGQRNDAVMTYGQDEAAGAEAGAGEGGAHAGHFSIIINNVFGKKEAIVEQAVIGLCGVMAAIAIMVMFLKAVALSRARRSTNRFLAAYQALTAQAGAPLDGLLADEDDYADSPLFGVYRQGLTEIRLRRSPAVGAAPAALDDKAFGAIRATLDAIMVREGQRLNSLLVLLTIAISGGPFIGLLGTVVGVMVTFAAIAATGDVNIAAIAPGMAAALLATVAGLGVAIPSLFGYNYLSAKAKDLGADMQVFADEFVARLNELHG